MSNPTQGQKPADRSRERLRVLIVEDRPDDYELMLLSLRRAGCQFDAARVVAESELRAQLDDRIDIIVSDCTLPDLDGLQVIDVAREMCPMVPIILVSGTLGEDFAVAAMREGASDYLLKSQIARLPQAMLSALERRRLQEDRARANEELRASQAQLAAIIDSAMDAIITVDEDQRITLFNRAAEQLFGCSEADALGTSVERFVPQPVRDRHGEHLRRFGESGIPRRKMGSFGSVVAVRADGSTFAAEATISQMSIGGRRFFTAIVRDVTERQWAEREREQLNERMLAGQKLESLGVLAGGIAHDFNNLLTAIRGNTEFALQFLPTDQPARPRLERALQGIQQAGQLTRQLLAYAGQGRTAVEPLVVSDLVRDLGALLETTLPAKVELNLELDPSVPHVDADVAQLQQLVLNLVMNATDACEAKGGTVTLKTEAVEVDPTRENPDLEPGRYVAISVADTGCGMDAATLARMYDPFFTTKPRGRGLGLSAALGIIKAHGGHVAVDSQPGVGTRFRVLLPPSKRKMRPEAPVPRDLQGNERILVVDDEPMVLDVIRMVLQTKGYAVEAYESPEEALARFHEVGDSHFDLAILDLTMPRMSGIELAESLRRSAPALRVLLTSGYDRGAAMSRVGPRADIAFLDKPFAPRDLLAKVRGILDERAGARAKEAT